MTEEVRPLLEVNTLVSGYGKKQILNGVDIAIPKGEIVALIGHNGAGKSTILNAIFGMIPIWEGKVTYNGVQVKTPKPRNLLCAGMAYIPQGNRVFTDLTVKENLEIGGTTLPNKQTRKEGIEKALAMFPFLRERLKQDAGKLSGGEKQMLALANALVLNPRMLLLDEPSLGLAPGLIKEALARIQQLNRDNGTTILIVEQKVREVLAIAHTVYALKLGQVVFHGPAPALASEKEKLKDIFL